METESFDAADYLETEQGRAELLHEAHLSPDANFIQIAEIIVERASLKFSTTSAANGKR